MLKKEAGVRFEPGPVPLKENNAIQHTARASASTAFAIEAAGISGHLVHISGLWSPFKTVKGKVRASYR